MAQDDTWLQKWRSAISQKTVLELGCGEGRDTRVIETMAARVTATDKNRIVEKLSSRSFMELDHTQPLPFNDHTFDTVVASLCLHYFENETTMAILNEIARVIKTTGLLICRLNSTRDIYYGARGFPQIEPGLYNVNGQTKRFFTRLDIEAMFGDKWQLFNIEEKSIDRYKHEKWIWEFGARIIK